MEPKQIKKVAQKVLSAQLAGRQSDPSFYNGLQVLPNPDPILRQQGHAHETFDAIESDAHVIGELRSIRGGLLSYQIRAVDGVDGEPQGKDRAAWELCSQWLKQKPAPFMTMSDVIWNMARSVFYGFSVHELVWQKDGGYLLPANTIDVPNRRWRYTAENELRLLTRDNQTHGIEVPDYKFVVTRHMPSAQNPYGRALFSSCFWPYTFKHGGWKFFYKFCERYGLPWPVGKYPMGSKISEQNELLDALVQMMEDGAGVIPEGDSVELMTVNSSGELAQESLIHLCNREMSKALTSQTLATEMHNVGSNAASQTHDDRQGRVQQSDRNVIVETFNEIFRWITLINFGADTAAPRFEFYKQEEVAKERAEIWEIATRVGDPSKRAFHEEMNIPMAEDDDDRMQSGQPAPTSFSHVQDQRHEFALEDNNLIKNAQRLFDESIENDWLQPIVDKLLEFEQAGKSLEEFTEELPNLFGDMSDEDAHDIMQQAMALAFARGMEDVG